MRAHVLRFGCLIAAAWLLSACAEDTPEIYILQNASTDDDCEPSTAADVFVSRGTLDLFVTNQYVMFPLARNSMVPSEDVSFGAAGGAAGGGLEGNEWEANTVTLRRARVEFDAPAALGVPLPSDFEIPISGSINPADEAAVGLQVVTPSIGNALAASPLLQASSSSVTMLVRIKFFGVTGAGREVDSNEFVFPIELCFGCLLDVPPEAIDPAFPTPNCRVFDEFDSNTVTDQCFIGQDQPVDCRLICPLVSDEDPTGICQPL